jgi:Kef-type K+ transport system membrane component KefB
VIPAVAAEIAAGAVVGRTGFGILHPADPTLLFLSQIGFLMLMFSAGMNVPLSDGNLRRSLTGGLVAAALAGALAIVAGVGVSLLPGIGHPGVYAVLMASSSAAIVVPVIQERSLRGPGILLLIAQVTIADVVATLAIPFVLRPEKAASTVVGTAITGACVVAAFVGERMLRGRPAVHRLRHEGKRRHWAIDLRVALVILFALAWVAQRTGASALIAGFGAGLMLAAVGGPKRLSTEVLGIAGGFFIPLFFVTLGAAVQLRGVVTHPSILILTVLLIVLAVAVHVIAARGTGQRASAGVLASAQLGVPAAMAALGLTEHVLSATQAAAIVTAAMATVIISGAAAAALDRRQGAVSRGDPGRARRRPAPRAS